MKQQRDIRLRGDSLGDPLANASDSWQSLLQSNPNIEITDMREVGEQDWEDAGGYLSHEEEGEESY